MTFYTKSKSGGMKSWVSIHWHNQLDLHLQLRVRSAVGGLRSGGYLDISLLVVTLSFGYWRNL